MRNSIVDFFLFPVSPGYLADRAVVCYSIGRLLPPSAFPHSVFGPVMSIPETPGESFSPPQRSPFTHHLSSFGDVLDVMTSRLSPSMRVSRLRNRLRILNAVQEFFLYWASGIPPPGCFLFLLCQIIQLPKPHGPPL